MAANETDQEFAARETLRMFDRLARGEDALRVISEWVARMELRFIVAREVFRPILSIAEGADAEAVLQEVLVRFQCREVARNAGALFCEPYPRPERRVH